MKNTLITIAMLVRQEKTVVVEVPDDFDTWEEDKKLDLMANVYRADDGTDFTDDNSWGCEEGTHALDGDAAEGVRPVYRADEDGHVEKAE